jgi:hypothetical protein
MEESVFSPFLGYVFIQPYKKMGFVSLGSTNKQTNKQAHHHYSFVSSRKVNPHL